MIRNIRFAEIQQCSPLTQLPCLTFCSVVDVEEGATQSVELQDVVFITAVGPLQMRTGKLIQKIDAEKIYARPIVGKVIIETI